MAVDELDAKNVGNEAPSANTAVSRMRNKYVIT